MFGYIGKIAVPWFSFWCVCVDIGDSDFFFAICLAVRLFFIGWIFFVSGPSCFAAGFIGRCISLGRFYFVL